MKLIVRDINGNTLPLRPGYPRGAGEVQVEEGFDLEPSRLEGLSIQLSDDSETLIVTLTLEESE